LSDVVELHRLSPLFCGNGTAGYWTDGASTSIVAAHRALRRAGRPGPRWFALIAHAAGRDGPPYARRPNRIYCASSDISAVASAIEMSPSPFTSAPALL